MHEKNNGPIKVNQKMAFSCLKWIFFGFSISIWVRTTSFEKLGFQYQVLNPNLETQVLTTQKTDCFQSEKQAIFDFILCFCTSLSSETWNLQLISQLLLFDAQQQKKVLKPSFSKLVFYPYFWGVKKSGFQIQVQN